jgi:cytochrome P450
MTKADTPAPDTAPRRGFDHSSDEALRAHHHVEWDRLREETPAFASDVAPDWTCWYVLTHDDAAGVVQDPVRFSSRHVAPHTHEEDHQWIPLELDPPEHTKYRHLLNLRFSPSAVAAMEPAVRARAVALIEGLAPRGRCDLVADFCQQFPTSIFMEIFGLPLEQSDTFLGWIDQLMHASDADDPDGSLRMAAAGTIYGYLGELIVERRSAQQDDLVSYLTAAQVDGRLMDDAELREMCFLLYMAGLDTVAGMLGYVFRHLAEHPDDRAALCRDETLVPGFVEEALRFYGIVTTQRVVTNDTTYAGCPMKAGDRVLIPWGAAERDPRAFPDADRFVLDRAPNRHLAFGGGPHRCLGSHLARLELRVAVEEWHRRIPDYRVEPDVELRQHIGGVAGLDNLPLVWTT